MRGYPFQDSIIPATSGYGRIIPVGHRWKCVVFRTYLHLLAQHSQDHRHVTMISFLCFLFLFVSYTKDYKRGSPTSLLISILNFEKKNTPFEFFYPFFFSLTISVRSLNIPYLNSQILSCRHSPQHCLLFPQKLYMKGAFWMISFVINSIL